ncbi:MAG TPA: class I SAM-dependent methyltransferase [Solirubrobacterales bacterium]|nr:class I SAM-dependent methyltransferase [Solirubrobacterales bacterium]
MSQPEQLSGQFHMNPETYLDEIRGELPLYDELQAAAVDAIPFPPRRVLELGVGTGETTRRLLERYPDAGVTGLDSQPEMVFHARELGIEVRLARMEDPLPDGPWDLVIAVLSVHHLPGTESATSSAASAPNRGRSCSATSSRSTSRRCRSSPGSTCRRGRRIRLGGRAARSSGSAASSP